MASAPAAIAPAAVPNPEAALAVSEAKNPPAPKAAPPSIGPLPSGTPAYAPYMPSVASLALALAPSLTDMSMGIR